MEREWSKKPETTGKVAIEKSKTLLVPIMQLRNWMRDVSSQLKEATEVRRASLQASAAGSVSTSSKDAAAKSVVSSLAAMSTSSSSKSTTADPATIATTATTASTKAKKATTAAAKPSFLPDQSIATMETSSESINVPKTKTAAQTLADKKTTNKKKKDADLEESSEPSTPEPKTAPPSHQPRKVSVAVVVPTKKSTKASSSSSTAASTTKGGSTSTTQATTGENSYARFKAQEFHTPGRGKGPVVEDPSKVLKHQLNPEEGRNVLEVLEEWRYGLHGGPALQDLYLQYGSHWKVDADKNRYDARAAVTKEYVRLVLEEGLSDEKAIKSLDSLQGSKALYYLYQAIREQHRVSKAGKTKEKEKTKKRSAGSDIDSDSNEKHKEVEDRDGKNKDTASTTNKTKRQRRSSTAVIAATAK
ncbi:hypothetical protein BGZ83_009480 [Gryganskiella cystojenkinii]|nr:hypothetical protein BGZ83_009480 [Gryganskiella cystojenkinii]